MFQLQNMDKQDMAELLAKYELELIDHADRLLSDEPLEFDSMHGYETIELLGNDVINLVKELDTDKQFDVFMTTLSINRYQRGNPLLSFI
ncbi:hypothetical protein U5S88_11060 [Streptococcus agalactiae]